MTLSPNLALSLILGLWFFLELLELELGCLLPPTTEGLEADGIVISKYEIQTVLDILRANPSLTRFVTNLWLKDKAKNT